MWGNLRKKRQFYPKGNMGTQKSEKKLQ